MKIPVKLFFCTLLVIQPYCWTQCPYLRSNFYGIIQPISASVQTKIVNRSWKENCPVPLEDLRYLTMSYWNYKGQVQIGHMIVHKNLAQEVLEIFKELFEDKFPIERMELIDEYDADDNRSMEANNSSCFCFRAITNNPHAISKHGYGCAIDINPKINPYIGTSGAVLPPSGKDYLDRTQNYKGIIMDTADNVCYQAFTKRGWFWGGHFKGKTDYQHFEKEHATR